MMITIKDAAKMAAALVSLGLSSCDRVESLGCAGADTLDQIPELVKAPVLQLMTTKVESASQQRDIRAALDQFEVRMEDIRTVDKGPGKDRSCKGVLKVTIPEHVLADANEYARMERRESVDDHLRKHGFMRVDNTISWPASYWVDLTPSGNNAKAHLVDKDTTDILFSTLAWYVSLPEAKLNVPTDAAASAAAAPAAH